MKKKHTYIIAEAGVNHNGDIKLAYKMIDAAKECGVDCIKFQTFKTENLVTKNAEKADYQVKNTKNNDSQYDMLKKLELSFDDFYNLKDYCEKIGIDFMSTPFDFESVDLLEKLNLNQYKISSGDITNKPLLEYIAIKNKSIILSTGMCTLDEVKEAVEWVENMGNNKITLLHCTSNYPTPYEDVNMKAMITMKNSFPYPIGYSDHTKGIIIPIMAVAMGATVIEKHFTLDKDMEGPDHKASLNVEELKEMVEAIRNIDSAFGDGVKRPTEKELSTIKAARKSIVAKCNIKKGEVFSKDNICMKRPGTGLSPKKFDFLIGKKSNRDYNIDDFIF